MHRVGLTKANLATTSSAAEPTNSVESVAVAGLLSACLSGGYDDRVLAGFRLFRSAFESETSDDGIAGLDGSVSAEGFDVDQLKGVVMWTEAEAVIKVVSEAGALALRDELLNFVAVNPALHARKQQQQQQQPLPAEGKVVDDDAAVAAAIASSMKKKAVESWQPLAGDSDGGIRAAQSTGHGIKESAAGASEEGVIEAVAVEWVYAGPMEGRAGKDEAKWVNRHAKVWLLHDFDYVHKWRCAFAWASKSLNAPEKTSRLDLLGTSALDGAATGAEIVASQKEHFKEVAGFSQHFAAAYKTKRVEKYMTTKDHRESTRYGILFCLAVALFDQHLITK